MMSFENYGCAMGFVLITFDTNIIILSLMGELNRMVWG